MAEGLSEILAILFLLACLTIPVAACAELFYRLVRRQTLGLGFWASLVGGTILLFFVVLALTLIGTLTISIPSS